MSLRIEQKLIDSYFTEEEPKIYTTGAYLVPMEITLNGEKQYVWVVDEFKDDSYEEGGKICSPVVYSAKREDLPCC